jgi:murein DD-endopeptidase MepM/ murein hydrolase activator NlpD
VRIVAAILLLGADLVGPVKYEKTGAVLDGKRWAWKEIGSIAETSPERSKEEFQAAAGKSENAVALATLAKDAWNKDALRRLKPVLDRRPPATALRPPFEGRWKAMVDTTGHHSLKGFALFAIDFMKVDAEGRLFRGTGKALEDFLGYDQEVRAAADGEVVQAEGGFEDLPAGQIGKGEQANLVTIRHGEEEHTFYAHLKKGSVAVKAGDKVTAGQPIGRVGNSGASGSPHLHFTLAIPIGEAGSRGWASVPWRLHGFKLVDAGGTPCAIDVKQARVQEGWTLLCP